MSAPAAHDRKRRPLRCRLGFHDWMDLRNDAGEPFTVRRRCGRDDAWTPTGLGWRMPDS